MASAIIVVVIFVLLALAILFICQNGGWQGLSLIHISEPTRRS